MGIRLGSKPWVTQGLKEDRFDSKARSETWDYHGDEQMIADGNNCHWKMASKGIPAQLVSTACFRTAELYPLIEAEAKANGDARIVNHSSMGRDHTQNKGLEEWLGEKHQIWWIEKNRF